MKRLWSSMKATRYTPPVLPLEHEREQVGLPELVGPGPLEVPHLVGMRAGGHLFQLVAGLVQHPGHGRGAGRQRRAAQQHVADPLAAPLGIGLLEHEDRALGQLRQAAALAGRRAAGPSARPGPARRTSSSRRRACAWRRPPARRSRRPAGRSAARCRGSQPLLGVERRGLLLLGPRQPSAAAWFAVRGVSATQGAPVETADGLGVGRSTRDDRRFAHRPRTRGGVFARRRRLVRTHCSGRHIIPARTPVIRFRVEPLRRLSAMSLAAGRLALGLAGNGSGGAWRTRAFSDSGDKSASDASGGCCPGSAKFVHHRFHSFHICSSPLRPGRNWEETAIAPVDYPIFQARISGGGTTVGAIARTKVGDCVLVLGARRLHREPGSSSRPRSARTTRRKRFARNSRPYVPHISP